VTEVCGKYTTKLEPFFERSDFAHLLTLPFYFYANRNLPLTSNRLILLICFFFFKIFNFSYQGEMERDCLITHGCANFMRDRFFVNSDQYRIHICERCGLTAQANLKKMTYECRSPMCIGRPTQICQVEIPYAAKLLLQELKSMCIETRIFSKNIKTREDR
jgi:RNA polymerase Rpb2, domain 7